MKNIHVSNRRIYPLIYALCFGCILTFSSCESFLSQSSTSEVADGDMFNDLASLENARIGMYNSLQNQYYYGGYFQLMTEAYSDNGATGGYDNLDLDELGYKVATPNNIYIENTWIAIYNTIYTANKILSNIDGIEDPLLSDSLRSDIKGEALTIRAMAHFDLLRMFGEHWDTNSPYGIPVVTSILPTDAHPGRNTVGETYDAILQDLTEAEGLLSDDDLRMEEPVFKGKQFITRTACEAIMARVYVCKGDKINAQTYASMVYMSGVAYMAGETQTAEIYSSKPATESFFEVIFDQQDKSQFNALTYARPDALRSEVSFLASEDLKLFFDARPGDVRANLVDYENNDVSIEPDGRTQKYRGEITQDNSAYVIRLSDIWLIHAECLGFPDGVFEINFLRNNRGLGDVTILTEEEFIQALTEERRAELNFEGSRYFDLAHFGMVETVLGEGVLPCFPIPQREVNASGGLLEQYPGY